MAKGENPQAFPLRHASTGAGACRYLRRVREPWAVWRRPEAVRAVTR